MSSKEFNVDYFTRVRPRLRTRRQASKLHSVGGWIAIIYSGWILLTVSLFSLLLLGWLAYYSILALFSIEWSLRLIVIILSVFLGSLAVLAFIGGILILIDSLKEKSRIFRELMPLVGGFGIIFVAIWIIDLVGLVYGLILFGGLAVATAGKNTSHR